MEFAQISDMPVKKAIDVFYHSVIYREIKEGISDMHCRSDKYLAQELLTQETNVYKQLNKLYNHL